MCSENPNPNPEKIMDYYTINNSVTEKFIEKKSEFIANLSHCDTEEQALSFLEKIRGENRKATHNVYAYIIREDNCTRYSDDGEPGGTAGAPVLNVLQKNNLTNICCVVTRYFGGILLGAGGLVRAYSYSCSLAVKSADIAHFVESTKYEIICDYSDYGKIKYFLEKTDEEFHIQEEIFTDNVTIILLLKYNSTMTEKFVTLTNGKIKICAKDTGYYNFNSSPF
jgi:uncharacterized YigZ family protein